MDEYRNINSAYFSTPAPRISGVLLVAILAIAILALIHPAHSADDQNVVTLSSL